MMKKKLKIGILGYGKMGKMIEKLAQEDGHEIVWRIEAQNAHERTPELIQKADVVIEFSQPEVAFDNLKACITAGRPVVSGTTGWLDRYEEIQAYCEQKKGAFLYASNFSIGVNLFFALNRQLARMMNAQPQYEVSMKEIHHTQKKDAPSGTAITLAQDILAQVDRKSEWVNQATEQSETLGIISERIDPTPGTHTITYQSDIDQIEIVHIAHSREGFARGALRAAEWIIGRQGSFGMADVLGQ